MDIIKFHTSASDLWFGDQIEILINESNLVYLVRQIELPFAQAEGSPRIAGAYAGLPVASYLPPSRHFFGDAPQSGFNACKVALLLCADCGELGCWSLVAHIQVEDDRIIWSDFEQPHRNKQRGPLWRYDSFGPFAFDRSQYEAALKAALDRSSGTAS